MAYENLCMYCFEDNGGESVCPHCGRDSRAAVPQIQLMPGSLVYHDRFLVGRALGQDAKGIVYAAFDTKKENRLRLREYLPRDCAERLSDGSVAPIAGMEDAFEQGLNKLRASVEGAEDPKKRHFFFEENGTAYIAQRKSAAYAAETEPDGESDGSGKKLGLIVGGAAVVVIVIAVLVIQLVGGALKPNTDVLQSPTLNPSASAWAPPESPTPTPYVTPTFAALVDPEQSWMDYTSKSDPNKDFDQQQENVRATPSPVPTVKPDTPSYKTISSKSSKSEIQQLQQRLAALGWLSASGVNGSYDSATRQAVKDFQSYVNQTLNPSEKLSVDGAAGPKTLMWLYGTDSIKPSPSPTPAVTPDPKQENTVDKTSTKTDIRAVQRKLIALGLLNAGGDDGVYGNSTVAAVKQFQQRVNVLQGFDALRVTGSVDPLTMAYLNYYVDWWEQIRQEQATPAPTQVPTEAPAPSVDRNSSKSEIQTLQRLLARVGLMKNGSDSGSYDSATVAAVAAFQEWYNTQSGTQALSVTGIADATTYSYLQFAAAQGISAATPAPTEIPDQPETGDSVDRNSPKESIQYLQQMLIQVGLMPAGSDDGVYDNSTTSAVAQFQEWVNQSAGGKVLDVTGSADSLTLSYLEEAVSRGMVAPTPTPQPTEAPDEPEGQIIVDRNSPKESIQYVQEMLASVGLLSSSEADGVYGSGTERAVRSFQRFVNDRQGAGTLEVSGICDTLTLSYLETYVSQGVYAGPTEAPTQAPAAVSNVTLTVLNAQETDGVYQIAGPKADFKWSADGAVASYALDVYDASGAVVMTYRDVTNTSGSIETAKLNAGETYEIRLGALPEGGAEADIVWTSARFRTPGSVSAPVLTINGQSVSADPIEIDADAYHFQWSAGGNVESYTFRIYEGDSESPLSEFSGRNLTEGALQRSDLKSGTTYRVSIGATDANGETTWADYRFTVPAEQPTPEPVTPAPATAPQLAVNGVPASDSIIEITGADCTLTWASDAENARYTVRILDASGKQVAAIDSTRETALTFPAANLNVGETYTAGVGLITDDGTLWTTVQIVRPESAIATPEPTEAPVPTDTPEPTRPPIAAPVLSINGIQSSDTVIELVGSECALAWSAGGDVSGYSIRIIDANGNELVNEASTTDTQRSFNTALLTPGMVYTIGIGAIPADGGDTVWTTAQFMLPAQPTEAPTQAPTVAPVAKPSIQIGSRATNVNDIPYLMDATAIFSWQAEGEVQGYRIYLTNEQNQRVEIGDTQDTSRTLPVGDLPAGIYQIHVGAIPYGATGEGDIVWNTLTFGIGSVAPTPTPEPEATATPEPWPITLSAISAPNDIQLVQMKLYQLQLLLNPETQQGVLDSYTLQAIASFQQAMNEQYDLQLPGIDPTNPDSVVDEQTLLALQNAVLQDGVIVIVPPTNG